MKKINLSVWIIILWLMISIASLWLPLNTQQVHLDSILKTPDMSNWLGYDDLGRPVLDRLIAGSYTSCIVAITVILLSVTIGTTIGTVSAYLGGVVDQVIVRIIDIFLAFPGILLAIALAGIMGPGIDNVVIALSVVGWVGFARLARAQTLSIKHREHVVAAEVMGTSKRKIVFRHLIPLITTPLLVEATFGIASVVIAEAGLSFLGLGVQAPDASWGSMIRDGTRYMLVAPHLVLVPGMALMLVVLAVNLAGDRLRDRLDVRNQLSTRVV